MIFRTPHVAVPMAVPSVPMPVASAPVIGVVDLSQYRGFQLGMTLLAVAKMIRMETSEARVVHQRPAVILELAWQPRHYRPGDSVNEVLFSFYNGELFRIGVAYHQSKTEGLTLDDVIQAISVECGEPAAPAGEITFPSINGEKVKVLAGWDDSKYSVSLVQESCRPVYGMVIFSKRLNVLAEAAVAEAERLDRQEAPLEQADRLAEEAAERRAQLEKARDVNKRIFRP